MDDASGGRGVTRRWLLAGGAAVVVGAGAGVGAQFLSAGRTDRQARPRVAAELTAALAAEQKLIADLDATTGGDYRVRRLVAQVRADHAAHRDALARLIAHDRSLAGASGSGSASGTPSGSGSPSGSAAATGPVGTPLTLAGLRRAEAAASTAGARRALRLEGSDAALLASIAACEAGHAELFG